MELDRAIRIINYDIDENVSESEQLEAFKVFFKELFDTDIQNSDGEYRSIYDVFSEANKKYNQKRTKVIDYERGKNMASNKIKIITNESGDWEIVRYEDFEASGHRLDIWDYRNLLEFLGYQVEVSEISDEEMEQIS